MSAARPFFHYCYHHSPREHLRLHALPCVQTAPHPNKKAALNATFSVANDAKAGTTDQAVWDDLFLKLDGPELLRIPVSE